MKDNWKHVCPCQCSTAVTIINMIVDCLNSSLYLVAPNTYFYGAVHPYI